MDDTSAQLEDLLAALAVLTEHNEQMLEKLQQQGVASAEQYTKQSELTNSVIKHFEQLQAKEKYLAKETIASIQQSVNEVFAQNKADYHKQINRAFTEHISHASQQLSKQVEIIKSYNEQLSTQTKVAKKDFDGYVKALVFNEDSYRTESAKLKREVGNTLEQVSEATRERLDALAADFASQLSTKTTLVLGAVCFSLILLTFFIAWVFIPSKAEIAERRANYVMLERYNVAKDVVKGEDGYYADIVSSTCFKAKDGHTYCKFR